MVDFNIDGQCKGSNYKIHCKFKLFTKCVLLKVLLHSKMKPTSLISCYPLISPILFFCSYDPPGAYGSGHDENLWRAYPDDIDGSLRGPDAHTGNIQRMRNYRSPDAHISGRQCCRKCHGGCTEKIIKPDLWCKFHLWVECPFKQIIISEHVLVVNVILN